MEVYSVNDLSLALFDCINNDNMSNGVRCDSEAQYRKTINDLIAVNEEAPISGVKDIIADDGLITFENGSVLYFIYKTDVTEQEPKEKSEEVADGQRASIDDFLNGFEVKS